MHRFPLVDGEIGTSIPRKQSGPPPLTMTKGPRGKTTNVARYPANPYAGSFSDLEATGIRRGGGVTVRSTNRFKPDRIFSTWQVSRGDNDEALAAAQLGAHV